MASRPGIRASALLVLSLGVVPCVPAQPAFPAKPIRIITPYAAGGSTSIMARIVGQQFTEAWGQQVIVESRPGGNGAIGTDAVAKAAPDGYTLVITSRTHTNVPLLQAAPYDPIRDFAPIGAFARTEMLMVLNNRMPPGTVQDFVGYAKARPGQLNFSSGGTGTASHLAGEFFNLLAGVKLVHVPYKGAEPAVIDLMGGHVQVSFQSALNVVPQIRAGTIKGLGVSGRNRLPAVPGVPTFTEAGLPDFNIGFWYGILGPAGIPKPLVDKLAGELAKLVARPDTKGRFADLGIEPDFVGPDALAATMKSDMENFARIIKSANIKLTQ